MILRLVAQAFKNSKKGGKIMNRLYQYLIIFVSFVVLIIGCSDHAMINNVTERDGGPKLASIPVGEEIVYTLTAVDWDGIRPFEPNIFYRIKDIN